jgi:hypothetical protein
LKPSPASPVGAIVRVPFVPIRCLHDHAVDAVPALHGLLIDERLLQRMETVWRTQPFQRDDMPRTDAGQRCHAGTDGAAINVHGTCAALPEAATEARSAQADIVSQHIEQRGIGIIDINRDRVAIHQKCLWHSLLPRYVLASPVGNAPNGDRFALSCSKPRADRAAP